MFTLIDAQNTLSKFNNLGTEGNVLKQVKDSYKKSTATIILNNERLGAFLLRSGTV